VSAPREIKLLAVSKLHRQKRNCRTHSKKQISQIANSIRRFGWTYPILTDESYIILAGHGRYDAALQLGLREVPIIVLSGLKDAERRALALADNQIAANAGWNRQLLAEELGDLATLLPECDLSLEITGFEAAEIDSLLGDLVDPDRDPADELPSPTKTAISKIGDLWELGGHKLLCGDSQSAEAVQRLMGTASATMVITDPPFNLPIRRVQGRGRINMQTSRKVPVKCHDHNSSISCASRSHLQPNTPSTAQSILYSSTGGTFTSSSRPDQPRMPSSRTSSCGQKRMQAKVVFIDLNTSLSASTGQARSRTSTTSNSAGTAETGLMFGLTRG
jgi:hypothetical protein